MSEVQKEEEPLEKLLQELEQEVLEEQDLLEQDLQGGIEELKEARKTKAEESKTLEGYINHHEVNLNKLYAGLGNFKTKIEEIDTDLNTITLKGEKRNFDDFKLDKKAQVQLTSYRNNLLSAMFQANSIKNSLKKIKNAIRKIPNVAKTVKQKLANLANKSLGIISQIAKKCIKLLSQFNNQMQIDSITVTFGISTT